MSERWKRHGKAALSLLGLSLLVYAIYRTGPLIILSVAQSALPFLPLIMLLNIGFYGFEALAHRQMLGPQRRLVPKGTIVRAMLSAFITALVFPLGRAGAEVIRTSILAPYTGAPRASAASASFQIPAMYGVALFDCAVFTAAIGRLGAFHPLTIAVLIHTLASAVLGTLLLLLSHNMALGSRLLRRFPKLRESAKTFDQALRCQTSDYVKGTAYCILGRVSEFAMYAVIIVAVSVPLSAPTTLIAYGIHVVGASAGEFIPGQLGTVEGAYLYFAETLGLAQTPARAVSMALLVRVAQYSEALLAFVALQLWPKARETPVVSERNA